ncbi:septal ring lytic transglycosylase RlpA family protein [Desulforhopalus sp. 52FAK]
MFDHHSRFIYVLVIFTTILSLFNGCSIHESPSQSSKIFEYKQKGIASYYGDKFQLRRTASGEIFNNKLMTAAHKTLPFGTHVLVTNVQNGKSVKVKINDRGPFAQKRIIDLSKAAFAKIENLDKGLIKVEIMAID